MNLVVTGTTADSYNSSGTRTTTYGDVAAGTVTLGNVGTVNIVSNDAGSSVTGYFASHTLTLDDAKAAVVNVSGNADLKLSLDADNTGLTTINASAMTGSFSIVALTSTLAATV